MILTRNRILDEITKKSILIEPFREECLGPNSYDVHLGRFLITYTSRVLDVRVQNEIEELTIPKEGILLFPGTMYLGVTEEYIESHNHVPFLEGISSASRLGINANASSGKGSIGHCNTWTIDINVVAPIRVYQGMPIAQIFFLKAEGEVDTKYSKLKTAKYRSRSIKPTESMMWKSKF